MNTSRFDEVCLEDARSPLLGRKQLQLEKSATYEEGPKRHSRRLLIALAVFSTVSLILVLLTFKTSYVKVDLTSLKPPLQPCRRTLLADMPSWNYGFGASLFALLQGSIFADTYGYTMLFSRDPAVQGTYLDFFTPATPTCIADESMYDVSACLSHSSNCQRTHGNVDYDVNVANHDADRMLYQRFGIFGVNTWYTRNTSFADIEIASLPHLDSSRPLPAENTLPPAMYDQFDLLESAMHKYFRFNAIMEAKMSAARHEIGKLAAADSPVIGVHYRGGDKLGYECTTSAILSCGNVTMHLESAWQLHQELYRDTAVKPTLVLVSAEANAVKLFQDDPLGSRFVIVDAPNHRIEDSYDQADFNQQPLSDRLDDTRMLLANLAALGRERALVVSSNSNLGRLAMLLAGRQRVTSGHVRAFDLYWHSALFKPIMQDGVRCDGSERCFP